MLRLFLLGAFRIERDSRTLQLPTRKVESLFAYLALHPEQHPREKLAALLWGDSTDEQARHSLRTALATLRKSLGDDVILADRETVQLNPDLPLWVDAREFQTDIDLYRGDLLVDFYDEWILPEREHYRALYHATLLQLVQQARSESYYVEAIDLACRVLASDRANEKAHQHLMFCFAAQGDRIAALKQYDECKKILREELKAEPSSETTALCDQIMAELTGAPSREAAMTNLPNPLTSFIGREKEIRELKELLATTRLITLSGAGGCGKTRLALQVSADLTNAFSDGAWFVELAPLADPALVVQTIAATFGLQEGAGRSLETALKDYLREKNLLLILDNCEHLIATCAQFADMFLHMCPHLKILATSREALGVAGETAYRVPSLAVPDPQRLPSLESLSQYDAVRLFIDRAISVQSTFSVNNHNAPAVAQICHRLGGIPLALELAAARVKIFSAEEIEARLDDRFRLLTGGSRMALPRQQTLRALIDWSFDLLSAPERVLLSRLSVFAGGWTFDAAEYVCADDVGAKHASPLQQVDILDLLSHLIDKSLVLAEEHDGATRYRMLETIRQYAREKLLESGELDSVQDRHLNFFLVLAEELEPQLRRERQQEYLDRLEREHDNLRTALEWSVRMHRDVQMLRLGVALYLFWRQRDFWSEARKWFKLMLALDAKPEHEVLRQKILVRAANTAIGPGDYESAKQWARACIESSQTNGERRLEAEAFMVLGVAVAWGQNEYDEAQIHLEQALALFRQVDDQMGVADAFHWLGHMALEHSEYARARSFFQDSYARLNDFGDRVSLTLLLNDLGLVSYLQEDYAIARAYSEQGVALCREIGSKFGMAMTLNRLGDLARCEGDYGRADTLYNDSLSLFKEMGYSSQTASAWHNIAHVRLSQGEGVQAAKLFHQALNEFREMGDKKGVTDCLTGLAGVAIQFGQPGKGARLLGASEMLKQELGATWWPANHIAYKGHLSRLHEQLDDATFNAAWAEGRAMTLEQAIEYALGEPVEDLQPSASAQPHDPNALTPREIEVLRLVQAGLSDAKIAEKLVISRRTVNTHLSSIYSKLGVNSRSAATRAAIENKII